MSMFDKRKTIVKNSHLLPLILGPSVVFIWFEIFYINKTVKALTIHAMGKNELVTLVFAPQKPNIFYC